MTEIEFNKLIEHEINWLSYYGLREDREKLNEESDVYRDVRSIGYTKRIIPLMDRCSPGLITCNNVITKNSKFEDLISIHFPKGDNKFTPIETFFILFPDRKMEIIKRLIPEPISSKGIYYKN